MCTREQLQDPNTPLDTLYKLGRKHPELFMKHPIVRLHLATQPGFIGELLKTPRLILLTCILKEGDSHGPEFLRKVATHPETPKPIHHSVASSPNISRSLARRYLKKDPYFHLLLAQNAGLDATLVRYLSQNANVNVRIAIAKRDDLGLFAAQRLARDTRAVVRWTLAQNPTCPPTVLHTLREDREPTIAISAQRSLGEVMTCPRLQGWVRRQEQRR